MLFYVIVALILGVMVIAFGIIGYKNKGLIYIIFGLAYLGLGIYGFFVKPNQEWIYILILIVLSFLVLILTKNKVKK